MSNIRERIKKRFPLLYEFYQHCMWWRILNVINRLKKMSDKEREAFISKEYRAAFGVDMDWENPRKYTEKMQIEKLYNINPLKIQLTDKFAVRQWVEEKIGEEYLIPLLGSWDKFSDINFNELPDSFVLKTNHGSAMNAVVKNKHKFNKLVAKWHFDDWMKVDFAYYAGLEMHYSQISPRKILGEQFIADSNGELNDYKFLCFHGKPYYCWVDTGRFTNHCRDIYDMGWKKQPWSQKYPMSNKEIPKPVNFDKMVEIVEILCEGIPQVRVDLYNVDGKIYFGEMTFTSGTGYEKIDPPEYDLVLGNLWGDVR